MALALIGTLRGARRHALGLQQHEVIFKAGGLLSTGRGSRHRWLDINVSVIRVDTKVVYRLRMRVVHVCHIIGTERYIPASFLLAFLLRMEYLPLIHRGRHCSARPVQKNVGEGEKRRLPTLQASTSEVQKVGNEMIR